MAISEQWANLLTPGLREIFYLQTEALAANSLLPVLFNVQSSSLAQENDLPIGGMGNWEEYKGAIEYDDASEGYKKTYTHVEYVRGFKVERKLVDDDQYNVINKRPKGLALGAFRTREIAAASVFNNAFTTAYAGGDAVELCDSAHPYNPNRSGSTHGNYGTTALSYAAITATRLLMRAYVDDRGQLTPVNPRLLLVPPELEETASDIINTMNKVDITDYHDNFVRRKGIDYLAWDYLTDANNWFLIDPQRMKLALNWFDRIPLEFAMDPTSDFRLEARYRGYMRYSYGWSDWRWIYGHKVT